MSYIEKEPLVQFLKDARMQLPIDSKDFHTRDLMLLNFEQYVDMQPAADVVEVKHGKWKKPTLNLECFADGYVICSECNVMLPNITEIPEYYYCPNCGAKMDGGAKDE